MYPSQNRAEAYQRQGVLTASPAELIVMLYGGCIRQLKLGILAIEKKEYERANNAMQKAERIIGELASSLDMRFEMSENLMKLYEYMVEEIVSANREKDAARIEPVVSLLLELKDAWAQIAKNDAGAMAAAEVMA